MLSRQSTWSLGLNQLDEVGAVTGHASGRNAGAVGIGIRWADNGGIPLKTLGLTIEAARALLVALPAAIAEAEAIEEARTKAAEVPA
jgi:hypothetical protein